jgi:hypothetical protein
MPLDDGVGTRSSRAGRALDSRAATPDDSRARP